MIMKTILVTGATGKVGSHFVPRLLQRENNVRLLVRRAEQAEAFRTLGAEVIVGDLSQPESLAAAVAGVQTVVHLAAFFRGTDQERIRTTNEDGALALHLYNFQKIRLYDQKQFSRNRGKT
jgi:uncharacterized protein YbjT (DUF2867 family)